MDIYEYMEGYDREFDENEFDAKLWEAMNEPDFELDESFEDFLHEYGIANTQEFLRTLRVKMQLGKI